VAVSQSSRDGRARLRGRRWRQLLPRWLDQRMLSESGVILFTALIVGIGAGLGAVIFRRLIEGVHRLAYGGLGGLMEGIYPFYLLIIPALGGAIFGPLIYRFAREAKGHGVPEVMEAVALRGGRIRPRVAIVKALASAICIGTGFAFPTTGCATWSPVVQPEGSPPPLMHLLPGPSLPLR
jgi:H+/Cl- antiporter ClcA